MNGVDDSNPSADGDPLDRLGVLEMGIHQGGGIEKPGAQMLCRLRCIALLSGEHPCRGERGHLNAETNQSVAMLVEVVWIRVAIAANVGTIRVGGIWPPVVPLGKIVVFSSGASRADISGDGDRLFRQIAVGCSQNS